MEGAGTMKLILIAALAIALTPVGAQAYTVKGSIECPEMMEEDANETFALANKFWLLGYLTGRNFENDTDVGRGMESDTIYSIALDFCRNNPSKDIDDAGIRVYDILKR
jgi:hypothetical protein